MPQQSPPPQRLWHYTSKEAMLGILGSASLWATSILYLNDADEFHHVRHLVTDWIKQTRQENSLGFPDEYRLLTGRQAAFVRFLERQLTGQRALHTYVASFSELADDLSQWRAYGGSGGFSLGFNRHSLIELGAKQDFQLYECVYDDSQKLSLVDALMTRALSDFDANAAQISDDDLSAGLGIYMDLGPSDTLSAIGDRFFLQALQVACRIKNKAFHAEREWRLVSTKQPPSEALSFRTTKSMLVPYVKIRLAEDEQPMRLTALLTGPSPHAGLNMLAAMTLCKSKSLIGLEVARSRLPYRDW